MDIYDKMCFTVSSAGGRRGAQMGTFDIGHPDAMDFIRAKRENGRLRQFNLSLLISDEFMRAVREEADWKLAFPITRREYEAEPVDLNDAQKFVWREWPVHEGYVYNEEGLVACRIYKTLPARRMWDVIMSSTYDFAEPGFILIDRVNEMNNNWWCENIRATNPCVTADTRLATQFGMVRIGDLYESGADLQVTVDGRALGKGMGVETRPAVPAFMTSECADVYRVVTEAGYEIKATRGTAAHLREAGLAGRQVNKVLEGRPHCVDAIESGEIQLVINTASTPQSVTDSFDIRRSALTKGVPHFTTIAGARAAVHAVAALKSGPLEVAPLQSYSF